jgi:hypothetical protein
MITKVQKHQRFNMKYNARVFNEYNFVSSYMNASALLTKRDTHGALPDIIHYIIVEYHAFNYSPLSEHLTNFNTTSWPISKKYVVYQSYSWIFKLSAICDPVQCTFNAWAK